MSFNLEAISRAIKQEIERFQPEAVTEAAGRVVLVGDGVAKVIGLDDAMISELVRFENDTLGLVLSIDAVYVSVIVLGSVEAIHEGDLVEKTGQFPTIPVGEQLLGRVIDPLGQPLDGKGPFDLTGSRPLEYRAPGVIERAPVSQPLQTGIKAIDSMIPIGLGQRELILGDRRTGKTSLVVDTIINQKESGVVCIYVAIGQKASSITQLIAVLQEYGSLDHTIIIAANASAPASVAYLAPFSGAAVAEHFMYNGGHAVCFYDDLTKHADAYRQLSLLLRRPSGREAYPGDIFYLHSRLLERAAKLNDELGGGSMTAIPIVETKSNDISAYIPTNVISITDGQIFLESDLFNADVLPAINVGLSVSRVGGKAQTQAMKKISQNLRLSLAQYRELAKFSQFSSELDPATRAQLTRGERMVELLKQDRFARFPLERQVMILFVGTQGYLDDIPVSNVRAFEAKFLDYMETNYSDVGDAIKKSKKLEPQVAEKLDEAAKRFKEAQR